MRLPRDLSSRDLIRGLERLGYEVSRQQGSHIRLTLASTGKHLTIPAHDPLKVGTLAAILREVAAQVELPEDEVVARLSGRKL